MTNKLLIGTADKTEQLLDTTEPFLLIDDGPIAQAFAKHFPKAKIFNPRRHSFNPLPLAYKQARQFAATLYTASPEGENTLTVRNGRRELTKLLLGGITRLSDVPSPETTKDPMLREALAMIEDILLSPVLRRVLCRKPNFTFEGSIIAKLDRAELGDTDAFVLAQLLIGQFQGQIIVPDGGFYLRDFHMSVIRQNRLTAGLTFLEEVPVRLRQALLSIKDKVIYRTTRDDAERLVFYTKHTEPRNLSDQQGNDFIAT